MLEDKKVCPRCGEELHEQPYLMAIVRDKPLLPWPWALALVMTLLSLAILLAGAH